MKFYCFLYDIHLLTLTKYQLKNSAKKSPFQLLELINPISQQAVKFYSRVIKKNM